MIKRNYLTEMLSKRKIVSCKKLLTLFLGAALILPGCTVAQETNTPPNAAASGEELNAVSIAEPFSDLRGGFEVDTLVLAQDEYNVEDLYTYTFNERTIFEGNEELRQMILENGKNPGLGVRALHGRGITGQGVSVAIIDQPLILEPPEFANRIADYYECDYNFQEEGSMHGPAVLSILAGNTIGVAPEAKVYYASAPSWTGDSAYYADCLNWIMSQNDTLPASEKIRVVSVSAAPSGEGSLFDKNQELWDEAVERAQAAGILVIDCRYGLNTGFIEHGFYDPKDPDNIEKMRNGWARSGETYPTGEGAISVPCDFRTTVEQYETGDFYFRYGGSGGLSWGIPYAAGVFALGWQVNPALTADEIKELLFESAYRNEYDELIIHPAAFIEAVEATLQSPE